MDKKTSTLKTGDTGKTPKGRSEKDIDDLVHADDENIPTELGEEDPDDLVHQRPKPAIGNVDEKLADPDDLVHDDAEDDLEP